MEDKLYAWIMETKDDGTPVFRHMIAEKGRGLMAELYPKAVNREGKCALLFSSTWFERFFRRYKLTLVHKKKSFK